MVSKKKLREEISVLKGELAVARKHAENDEELIDLLRDQAQTSSNLRDQLQENGKRLRRANEVIAQLTADLEALSPATDLTNEEATDDT